MGARGSDADFKTVLDYLVANLGISDAAPRELEKVNVNRAAGWRIARALKLLPEEGDAIVAYREDHGDFKSLDDLAKVVDRAKVEAAKDRILFQD
ncbi:MAG: helix-hairpin-helix domain-containing protein, partial [Acidobacteriia bacterium]|nr:helix-hairpin-helix domain-containing protein [Terriglobia bacterium]